MLNQSFSDYELIIVDDASSDGSAAILEEYAENDKRITVVRKSQNEGLHLGHRTAIEKCSGDYILFLDADDEFEEGLLGKVDGALREDQQIDMLHFGIRVIGEGVSDESCSSFESFVNQPVETLEGVDILSSVFGGRGSYRQDWRMPQRAFSARLLKDAFSKMPVQRLDCAEDAFEMFVISSLASKEVTRNDIIGIRYHLGRGLNGASPWTADKFASVAESFWACSSQIQQYADSSRSRDSLAAAKGAKRKLMQLLFNDWRARVLDDEKMASIEKVSSVLDTSVVFSEVMRCVRDASYETLTTGTGPDAGVLQDWRDAAYRIAAWSVLISLRICLPPMITFVRSVKWSVLADSKMSRFAFLFLRISQLKFSIVRFFSPFKLVHRALMSALRGRCTMMKVTICQI